MYEDVDYLTQEEKEKMDCLINQFQIDQYNEFKKNALIYEEVLKNVYKTWNIYNKSMNKFNVNKSKIINEEIRIINDGLRNLNFKMREMIYQIDIYPNEIEENILREIYRIKEERKYQKEMLKPYLPLLGLNHYSSQRII
jgi:hypothetical protein